MLKQWQKRRSELRARQMEENFRAWAKHIGAPPIRLLGQGYPAAQEDRILFHYSKRWKNWIKSAVASGRLYEWDFKIEDHRPLLSMGLDETTAVEGWHDTKLIYSAQLVLHQWYDLEFLEGDFDLGNAASGLLGMVIHGTEWIVQRIPKLFGRRRIKVNPFRVAKHMRKSGIEVKDVREDGHEALPNRPAQ